MVSGSTARIICYVFRCDRAPFTDKRVRQALNYAVDKKAIIKNILGGLAGETATAPLAPSVLGAKVSLPPYPYDPQKARALLHEAGAQGATILMGASNGRFNADAQIAQAVQGYLQNVGLNVKLETDEWPTYISSIPKGPTAKFDMYLLGFSPATFDSDYYRSQWVPPQSTIWNGYNNPQLSKQMDDASLISDRRLAELAYHPVMAELWDDTPFLYLYFEREVDGADRRLTGFTPLPDQFLRFASFSLPA